MAKTEQHLRRDRAPDRGNELVLVLGVLLAVAVAAIALFSLLGGDVDLDADAAVDPPDVDLEADAGGVDVEEDEAG